MKQNDFVPYINPKNLTEKYLQKAIFKKVIGSEIFQYPLFAIVGLIGLGFIFGFHFFLAVACILLVGISAISWVIKMFIQNDKLKLQYIQELKQLAEEEIRKKNKQLSKDLVNIDIEDAAVQLNQFQSNFKNFVFTLDKKFNPEELA